MVNILNFMLVCLKHNKAFDLANYIII